MSLQVLGPTPYFWQWDTGRKLEVTDTSCGEVHFCNGTGDCALVVKIQTQDDGTRVVDVPNILLQTAKPIRAWLFQRHDNGAKTRVQYTIQVLARSRPDSYVYEETEVLSYAHLDRRLTDLEGEGIAQAVAAYLEENPVEAGATAAEAAQIQQNKTDIEALTADKLDAEKLPEAVNDALAQAKESGVFDGEPGQPGDDYVLTDADKQEIAKVAAGLVEVPEGGGGSSEWKLIADITLEENANAIAITKLPNGENFEVSEIIVYGSAGCLGTTDRGLNIKCNGTLVAQLASGVFKGGQSLTEKRLYAEISIVNGLTRGHHAWFTSIAQQRSGFSGANRISCIEFGEKVNAITLTIATSADDIVAGSWFRVWGR